jgi:hypothetical protein
MWQDPIVEEVRAAREAYAKRFGDSWQAMYEDLKRQEAQSGRTLSSRWRRGQPSQRHPRRGETFS